MMKKSFTLISRIICSAFVLFPFIAVMAQPESASKKAQQINSMDETIMIDKMRKDGASDQRIADYIDYRRKQRQMMATPEYQMWKNNVNTILSSCNNTDIGVEGGTFATWQGFTGSVSSGPIITVGPSALPVANQITIVTAANTEPCANIANPLPLPSPTGGTYSIKLGNNVNGADAERLEHTFVVQPTDTNFVYQYAVVFEDPSHSPADQPFMEFVMYDIANNVIPCSYQKYVAGAAIPGFYNSTSCSGVRYKPWTTVGVNLTPYIGQSVKVQVTNADCALTGHWGHSYLDFMCGTLSATTQYCIGEDSILLCAPNEPGFTYSWSTGETTSCIIANPQLVDTVVVNVIPPSNCGFYLVYVLAPTIINAAMTYTINCNTATFTDNTSITGGTISSWQWSFPGGSPASYTGQSPGTITYPVAGGTFTVSLDVISQAGCTDTTINVPITILPPPVINAGPDISICTGFPATLCGSGGVSYTWIPSNQTTTCITVTSASTYTLVAADANGCSGSDVVVVGLNTPIAPLMGPNQTICIGGQTQINVSTGNPNPTYTWSPTTGLSNPNISNPIVTPPVVGSVTYSVTTQDANGCTTTGTETVTTLNLPVVTASGGPSICIGQTVANLTSNSNPSGVTYAWAPGNGLGCATCQNTTAAPTQSMTYTVTITDAFGCSNTGTVPITVNALPFVSAIASTTICSGDSATLNANASNGQTPYFYSWSPPNALNSATLQNPTAGPATPTSYTVVVTDANGCTDDTTTYVFVQTVPSVSWAEWDPTLTCEGYILDMKTNVSSNGQSVFWDFGDGTSMTTYAPNTNAGPHSYPFNGTYNVTVIVYNLPCKDTVDTTIIVSDIGKGMGFCAANVFTPNSDLDNPCFQPALMHPNCNCVVPCSFTPDPTEVDLLKQCMYLEVYDRWGIKMFETTDTKKCWDGKNLSGSPAKEGSYYYIAKLGEITLRGYVELLR